MCGRLRNGGKIENRHIMWRGRCVIELIGEFVEKSMEFFELYSKKLDLLMVNDLHNGK